MIITIPNSKMEEIQKIQETFIWYYSKPRINHKTSCNTFEERGLENVDVKLKNS